jgi:hypothetical protein
MRGRGFASLRPYMTVCLFILAVILTCMLGGKATHQGMVLGLVSIVMGLLIIYLTRNADRVMIQVNAVMFVILELAACVVVWLGSDPVELWFASCYAIFSILMLLELFWQRMNQSRWR